MRTHMVDTVDPDSVDFQPLFKSINGAAMTALHQDFQETGTQQPLDPMSRFQGGRSQSQENHYFSVDANTTDPNVADPNTANTKTYSVLDPLLHFPSQCSHRFRKCISYSWSLEPFSQLSSGLSIKLMSILCTTVALVVFMNGALSNYFNISRPNFSSNNNGSTLTSSPQSTRLVPGRQTGVESVLSHQGISLAPPKGTKIPSIIGDVFADVSDLPMELMDTAIYWHIPRSAGTTMKHILATCLGRVVTTEIGGLDGHQMDEKLQMIRLPHGVFLNVDTTTPSGLRHAHGMGLAQSKMADVIFTPYIHEAAVLFDSNHRGRFFTILREPVDRMISLYYYKRLATWEPNYNSAIKEQTLEDFTQTYGENWMVRTLTGSMSGPLQLVHLNVAKEILRRKV